MQTISRRAILLPLAAVVGLCAIAGATVLRAGAEATPASLRLRAQPAKDFIDGIGVNTHLSWVDTAWGNWEQVAREIDYLGITQVRDGIPYIGWTMPAYERLARAGVRFTLLVSGPDVDIPRDLKSIAALETAHAGSVHAVEGPNEFNVNHLRFEGADSYDDPAWGGRINAALHHALLADPVLGGIKLVSASLANADLAAVLAMGDQSEVVDAGNWHVYFSKGDQPRKNIRNGVALGRAMAKKHPVHITETGYYTAVDAMNWGGGGVSEEVQARLTLNLLLDAYREGADATFLYALQDNIVHPASDDLENSFGLFRGDGTPKAAATAIRNLVSQLSPTGEADADTLDLAITGLPESADHILLQRGPGRFALVLWNEPDLWDQATRSALPVEPVPVEIALKTPAVSTVFDPIADEAAVQAAGRRRSISIDLADRPIVVDIDLDDHGSSQKDAH